MTALAYPAPAKINLMLRVLGRRGDGYHELQTVFQFLDWGDSLCFDSIPGARVRRSRGPAQVSEDQDLCVRAALRLQELTGCREGVAIDLDKILPMGGGIGGGSSDAATTLLALNHLWGLGLGGVDLQEIALGLGADVPVFVFGRAAWGEGLGERLSALPALPEPWYVLVHPGVSVETRAIFTDPELTRNHPPITMSAFFSGAVENTLEPTVVRRYPEIGQAIDWLREQGLRDARLTGSGACCFGTASGEDAARGIAAAVPGRWRAWAVRGLNRHPLSMEPPGGGS